MNTLKWFLAATALGLASLPAPGQPPAAAADDLDSNPPPEVAYFYDDLSPYGAWLQLSGVGWCWQPGVVASLPGWRPYCHAGHWVWTDAGWDWESDYPWGWAPFHYGRWFPHPSAGWVWVPDTTWGPAWVTWRVAADQCGWAPLPPHADFDLALGFRFNGVRVSAGFDFGLGPDAFTFIGLADFTQHDLDRRLLASVDVARVFNRTTVVKNYVVNHAMVNRGIAMERVAAATHHPVRKAVIRDLPPGAPHGANLHGTDRAIYRPHLTAPALKTPIVARKVDDRHPLTSPAVARAPANSPRPETPRPVASRPEAASEPRPAKPPVRQPEPAAATAIRPARAPATRPAPAVERPPAAAVASPQGRATPRGVEVYRREPGPSFAPPPRAAAPAASQTPRQLSPKTAHQESESRRAPPAPRDASPANNSGPRETSRTASPPERP